MYFNCPSCKMNLSVSEEHAGKSSRCPGCGNRVTVPSADKASASAGASLKSSNGAGDRPADQQREIKHRTGWKESDPANPNLWLSLGVGIGINVYILLLGLALRKTYVYTILFDRGWVNFAETFVFSWGMAIVILKYKKLVHQRNALLLDVLPQSLGREINSDNVSKFVDHVYGLPVRLRDSLMVNRIRKGLELFEVRPSNADVAHMMSTQSDIDSIRIAGSYSLIKVFIWAIPILGFVGTVLGLSAAIGNFSGVMGGAKDIDALMGSLGGVTSGLGTSFDTTLLGLIYSILLSFPMSGLQKGEDDSLNTIDAYCNETLLPRLNDDGGAASGGAAGPDVVKAMNRLVERVLKAQSQLVADLKDVTGLVGTQMAALEERAKSQSDTMVKTFTGQTEAVVKSFTDSMQTLQRSTNDTLASNVSAVTAHVAAIDRGLNSLNAILAAVGEKQVHVELKPRSVWQRMLGR
jgi:hypothetical protein